MKNHRILKHPGKNNQSATETRSDTNMFDQVPLVYDTPQHQQYTTNHIKLKKLHPSGN